MTANISRDIVKILISHPVITFSWGFSNVRAQNQGVTFNVQGYLHKGDVEVLYDRGSDTFIVKTLDADGSIKEEKRDVYADELVDTIDNMVEYCENYVERVTAQYLR